MRAERQTGAGRREFGRLVLSSLVANARAELQEHRARGRRLRARRALRRLEELELALERLDRGIPPLSQPWYARRAVAAAATLVFAVALAGLVAAVVRHGPSGLLVGVADIVLLLATLLWFTAAVGRRTAAGGRPTPPPNEGSPIRDGGR